MGNLSLKEEILVHINAFTYEKQRLVMDYICSIESETLRGVSGKELVRYAGLISPDDLAEMATTIQAGCEQVDSNEW